MIRLWATLLKRSACPVWRRSGSQARISRGLWPRCCVAQARAANACARSMPKRVGSSLPMTTMERTASALSTLHDEFDAAVEEADGLLVDLPEAERLQRRVALHAAGAASAVVDSEDEAVVRRPKVAGVSAAAVDRP